MLQYRRERIEHREKMADEIFRVSQEKENFENKASKKAAEEKAARAEKEAAMTSQRRKKATKDMVEFLKSQV